MKTAEDTEDAEDFIPYSPPLLCGIGLSKRGP